MREAWSRQRRPYCFLNIGSHIGAVFSKLGGLLGCVGNTGGEDISVIVGNTHPESKVLRNLGIILRFTV
jgi:hypothetical protein